MTKNLEELPIVQITWVDAHGGGVDWGKGIGKISDQPDRVETVGFLAKETPHSVMVCLSRTQRGHVDAYILIPRENIRTFHILTFE